MKLSSIGLWLVVLGLGSFALNFFNYEFRLLAWVDHWGATTGAMIRVACVAVGLLLMFLGRGSANDQD